MAQSTFGNILKWTGALAAFFSLLGYALSFLSLRGEGPLIVFALLTGGYGLFLGPLLGVVASFFIFFGMIGTWSHSSRLERFIFAGVLLLSIVEVLYFPYRAIRP